MHDARFAICPFHPVDLHKTSYVFTSSNLFQKQLKLKLEIWILSRLIQLDSVERPICTKVFRTQYLKRKHYKIFICYFHKFSVQDHLHEHFCTLEQLVGQTLIEIESEVAKQTKNVQFRFFQNILTATIFYRLQIDI